MRRLGSGEQQSSCRAVWWASQGLACSSSSASSDSGVQKSIARKTPGHTTSSMPCITAPSSASQQPAAPTQQDPPSYPFGHTSTWICTHPLKISPTDELSPHDTWEHSEHHSAVVWLRALGVFSTMLRLGRLQVAPILACCQRSLQCSLLRAAFSAFGDAVGYFLRSCVSCGAPSSWSHDGRGPVRELGELLSTCGAECFQCASCSLASKW